MRLRHRQLRKLDVELLENGIKYQTKLNKQDPVKDSWLGDTEGNVGLCWLGHLQVFMCELFLVFRFGGINRSNTFLATGVIAAGLWICNPLLFGDWGYGSWFKADRDHSVLQRLMYIYIKISIYRANCSAHLSDLVEGMEGGPIKVWQCEEGMEVIF